MGRRQKHQGHVNHERWLVSYADFITLLFAFFVVMYAISSVNEGKYKVLSSTLKNIFETQPSSSKPISLSQGQVGSPTAHDPSASEDQRRALVQVQEHMQTTLSHEIRMHQISIVDHGSWLEVNIRSELLFDSGSAVINQSALVILARIADELKGMDNVLRIAGYTDNQPIVSPIYPSNWELSAARAVSVLRFFSERGVDEARMAAIAYGEFHPVADNSTEEGRQRNRRVMVAISGSKQDAQSPFLP